ncbi:MAG: hypothetical protein F4118_13050 [Acidimicrobiaceae bacterium]|nr:hypothetical protein [Candidatus Poribacteria bacterium]MYI37331.1 hypothetical protein [Acidimicrobiaceae bacterium]
MMLKFARYRLFLFILCFLCIFGCDDVRDGMLKVHITGGDSEVEVTGLPPELVESYKAQIWPKGRDATESENERYEAELAQYLAYYTKYIDAGGIAIVGNHYVRDEQFYAARETILTMTSKYPEMREQLSLKADRIHGIKFRVILLNAEEPVDSEFSNEFSRETGGWAFPESPRNPGYLGAASFHYCVARVEWEPRPGRGVRLSLGVLVHEFAHALHEQGGIEHVYPGFNKHLRQAYNTDVRSSGSGSSAYTNSYGGTNHREYWAELSRDWFTDSTITLTQRYKWRRVDQLMLPIMEDLYPKISLIPLSYYLERPVEWDWDN